MAIAPKTLAGGQLANAKGTLYTTPGSTETIITSIKLVNTNTSAEAVNLYIKPNGGTSRRIIPVDMSLGIGYMLEEDNRFTLEAGALIEGDTTTASKVDYIIMGIEKT